MKVFMNKLNLSLLIVALVAGASPMAANARIVAGGPGGTTCEQCYSELWPSGFVAHSCGAAFVGGTTFCDVTYYWRGEIGRAHV